MNNHFDKLMYEAGLTAQGCWDSLDEYNRKAIELFAELIVRECMTVADKTQLVDRQLAISVALKEHFGVE